MLIAASLRSSYGFMLNEAPRVALRRAFGSSTVTRMMATNEGGVEVGFIGLGYMGQGMVRRLLGRGDSIVVWNRSKEKSEKLADEFKGRVKVAGSPKEVIDAVPITFSMLSTPAVAREVLNASNGILSGISKGKSLVDCGTFEVSDIQEFASAIEGKGGRFLEAPVSGSKVPAEQGQLLFLSAGNKALYNEVQAQLEVMGKAHYYFGPTGKGTEMKLVVNMIMGTMITSLAEGITLADKAGLPTKDLISVLGLGAMQNPMFALKGSKILADDHTPNFPLKHQQKDMAFAIHLAEQLGVEVSAAVAANNAFKEALAMNLGDLDFSAVSKVVQKAAEK